MIKFSCKKCDQKLNVEDKHSGKRVKCPKCGSVGVVPDNSEKIKFNCKSCGQSISVPRIHAGKKGKCPKCKNPVVIPSVDKGPASASETFIIVVCPMCNKTIHVPETSRGQTIECPACGSYIDTQSDGVMSESDAAFPPTTDEDDHEDDSGEYEGSGGMDRRLILVISGVAAVVVVGLVILVTVILPSRPDEEPIEAALLPKPGDVVINSIGMKLVYIHAGSFVMGSNDSAAQLARDYTIKKEKFSNEFPQHQVRISESFWMGQTEVTQGQYKSVMNAQPWSGKPLVQESTNNPAVYVSWDEAVAFCRKLSQQEGKTFRLPTEAEWEYACRAGTTTRFSFGDSVSSLGDHAWFYDNTDKVDQDYAHPVGQKKPNPWGLYDMHGNVWERCSDRYDKDYYSNSPSVDPKGPSSGSYRSLRGGSWLNHEFDLRCSYRSNLPFDPDLHIGFRIVCSQIIPLPVSDVEPDKGVLRQEVGDTDLRPQPVTSETQPTEPIVQEPPREKPLPDESISSGQELFGENKIAFASDRDGNYEVYIMNEDGNGVRRLTNNTDVDAFPSWSPDGKKIAFESRRDGNPEIYVMNSNGTEQRNLTNSTPWDQFPSWSPDGQNIVFHSLRDENHEIYTMNSDGSELKRLTDNSTHDMCPLWSPDGKKIAFIAQRDGNHEIYIMNSDGSEQTRLTNNPARDTGPAWSPDGKKITFTSNRDGNYEIYVMGADGSDQKRLTNNPASDGNPSWSSDGKRIAFVSDRDGNREIYVMNADGSEQKRLTNNPAEDRWPSWSSFPLAEAKEKSQKEESLPSVQYKLKFEKGRSYYVRVISDSNSVYEVKGQQSVSEVTSGFGYSFDVNEVDEKGNGWVDCTVDWVKLMRKAPMIDVTYDSSKKTSRVPPLAQSVVMYLGESFSAKMTPQGQVEELKGLEKLHRNIEKKMPKGRMEQQILQTLDSEELANSIKDLFLSPMAVYPDKPVGIGDSWSRTGFLSSRRSFILENKWMLQDRKAGIAIIEASATIKSQPDAVQRQDVKVKYDMSGKQAGQIEIKESTGQIICSKITQDLSGQAHADATAIRMKTYAVTTFEMSKRD
jgi:Tol biopolymer transport system component/formylglycine-generating enzyme required for sulfatase activity/DNA-directed RNA polymerase subunit RPC12/RpoP